MIKTETVVGLAATYSPDDGGWYSTVTHRDGREEHTTELYNTKENANFWARRWILGNIPVPFKVVDISID